MISDFQFSSLDEIHQYAQTNPIIFTGEKFAKFLQYYYKAGELILKNFIITTDVYLPSLPYPNRLSVLAIVDFSNIIFAGKIDFGNAFFLNQIRADNPIFGGDCDFNESAFEKTFNCGKAFFNGNFIYNKANFGGGLNCKDATFKLDINPPCKNI
jgi:hypothetical protein